jgi:uncharacterized OsmC-like protein
MGSSSGEQILGSRAMMENAQPQLNDVDIDAVASCASKIRAEPDAAATKWSAVFDWKGGFRSEATIREFDPFTSDEPDSLGGTNIGPNPVEPVLAAFGNCLAIGYAANATVADIKINSPRIKLEGELDLHVFLGLKEGNAGLENITVKVDIDSDASETDLQALHVKVSSTSPLGHTLGRVVPISFRAL